ncbi:MAG TPA: hypothetical protein PKE65_02365, partial [Rhizobiaceae bacterium]|nr:hypothetical protein [Rhizobiaceae bacterium]
MQNTDSTLDFLEFAALEPVRQAIASGDAVAVFNEGLERVIQSNRSMAALFGFKSVEAFLEAGLIASPTARRQFMQAVSALEHHGEAQNVMVRIASGMRSRLTPAHGEKGRLPSGEEAVAIACAGGRFGVAPATIAAELVGERDSAATAAFDASGATIAASRRFAALGVDASEIASLLRSVEPGMEARENRAVDTAAGRFAALALRLHDDPFLALVTIDENRLFAGEKAEGEVDAKSSAAMRDVADDTARAAVSGDRAASPFAGRFTSRRPSLPGETRAGAPVAPRWYFRGPIAGSAAVPADAEVARERESQIPVQSPDEETLFGGGMSTVPSSASGDEHSLPEAQTMHETDEHRDSEAGHKDAASGSATDLAPRWSAKSPPPLPMLNAWGLRPSEPVETAREAALETEFAQAPAGEASGSFSFGDDKSRPPLPLVADDESEAEILSGYDNDDAGGDESWPGLIATVPERDEYDDPGAAPDAYLVDAREDAEDLESLRRLDGADAPERERSFVSDPARAGFETIGDPAIAADKRVPERATSAAENDAVDPAREVDTPTAAEPLAAKPAADTGRLSGPVRFVWKMDGELRFTEASPEFARAVGPNAADIIGRTFRDVATVFGLDPQNEIQAMLDRRDTWSGRIVLWPVQGTDLRVPVELAALPAYGRGRLFEGYRGFGIARMHDAVVDPEELGLSLTPHPAAGPEADSAIAANAADGDDDRSQGQETPPSAGIGDFEPAPTALT